jgi:carboxymethylenebutenolidase
MLQFHSTEISPVPPMWPRSNRRYLHTNGELDTRITSGWPAFDAELTAAHVTHAGYVYGGANHGFHNDTTPRYDEAAAKLAWQRTLDWLNKYLRATG